MKVVEVIAAVRTLPAVVQQLKALVEVTGHRAVIAADQPGFLINHAGRGLYTEGLRVLEEQIATSSDIDDILRDGLGFKMGPFELMDLTGLDVSSKVMTSIYEQFQQEPRFRPSALVAPRVAAGLFGRKTGQGWYVYQDGQKQLSALQATPELKQGLRVWVEPGAQHMLELTERIKQSGATLVSASSEAELCIVQPWGQDATHTALQLGLDPTLTVALEPLISFDRRRTLMLTAVTKPDARDAAYALLTGDGVTVTLINDSVGFVAQRVIATIVNIAAEIAQRGIASVADLEDAVRLGLGYPRGPLTWGDQIGPSRVVQILQGLEQATGDPRYRASAWLARRATLGVPLLTIEAQRNLDKK